MDHCEKLKSEKWKVIMCSNMLLFWTPENCNIWSDLICCVAASTPLLSTWPKSGGKSATPFSSSLNYFDSPWLVWLKSFPTSNYANYLNNFTISVWTRHLLTVARVTFPQLSPSILWISPPVESVQISIKMLIFTEKFKLLQRINNPILNKTKRR